LTLVIDASVAAKWVLPEPESERALALRNVPDKLIAPAQVVAEVANAIWKYARRGSLSSAEAAAAVRLASSVLDLLVPLDELVAPSLEMALRFRHSVYDCFYLALAAREAVPLITADARQFEIARRARIEVRML
jgi:predicted nucleic acid-binding protein